MNKVPGGDDSIKGHNVRGLLDQTDRWKRVMRDKPMDGLNIQNGNLKYLF